MGEGQEKNTAGERGSVLTIVNSISNCSIFSDKSLLVCKSAWSIFCTYDIVKSTKSLVNLGLVRINHLVSNPHTPVTLLNVAQQYVCKVHSPWMYKSSIILFINIKPVQYRVIVVAVIDSMIAWELCRIPEFQTRHACKQCSKVKKQKRGW